MDKLLFGFSSDVTFCSVGAGLKLTFAALNDTAPTAAPKIRPAANNIPP